MNDFRAKLSGVMVLAGVLLSGCGGGGDDASDPFGGRVSCASIGGTVTEYPDPGCPGCQIRDAVNAADGTLGAWATIALDPFVSGSGPAIRATATEHTPGGTAGAWVRIPEGAQGWTITVRTYLADSVRETATLPSTYPAGSPAFDTYVSIETSLAFDAIEVQVSDANFTAVDKDFRIYELCSDSSVQGQAS